MIPEAMKIGKSFRRKSVRLASMIYIDRTNQKGITIALLIVTAKAVPVIPHLIVKG